MRALPVVHGRLALQGPDPVPEIDLVAAACRAAPWGSIFDVLDFRQHRIDRWSVPTLPCDSALARLRRRIPSAELPLGAASHEDYYRALCMTPHTAQIARNGMLLVGLGDPYSGFCVLAIDTARDLAYAIPEDWHEGRMLYGSTGGFLPGGARWLFLGWPFDGGRDVAEGRAAVTDCRLWELDTESLAARPLHRLTAPDAGHQLTCSPDGRFAVFAPFKWDRNPALKGGLAGSGEPRATGLRPSDLVTVDLETGRHTRTPIPVPVSAHAHFDPLDPEAFYLSAHNIRPEREGTSVEGAACIYRMRLKGGLAVIEGEYSDEAFFRISQHSVFCLDGRTVIAVTNLPNHLDLIDGRTMRLRRRREIFPAPALDLGARGSALCPAYPQSCLSLCASADGRHVVLESAAGLRVYDVREDRLLDIVVPQHLPEGARPVGHLRTPGE
jgi:hypothetical protein